MRTHGSRRGGECPPVIEHVVEHTPRVVSRHRLSQGSTGSTLSQEVLERVTGPVGTPVWISKVLGDDGGPGKPPREDVKP